MLTREMTLSSEDCRRKSRGIIRAARLTGDKFGKKSRGSTSSDRAGVDRRRDCMRSINVVDGEERHS